MKEWEGKELFKESWKKIKQLTEREDLKVLVSTSERSDLSHMIKHDSGNSIEVQKTDTGLKYSSDEFKQLIYADEDSAQTTIPYWCRKNQEETELTSKSV